jgi:prepilin-type processing-associated H-X9-DG protein
MRQLYIAMEHYTSQEKNYVMPGGAGSGSGVSYSWWGIDVLGKGMGIKRTQLNNGTAQNAAANRIMKLLNCPSVNRPDPEVSGVLGGTYYGDYTYNGNLGDFRYYLDGTTNGLYNGQADTANRYTFAQFKKRNMVPGNVLVAIDLPDLQAANDDRFGALGDLCLASGSRPLPRAGRPHQNKRKANALFMDGSVRLVKGFLPQGSNYAPTGSVVPATTELADWMIKSPDYLKGPSSAPNYTNNPANLWQKGRPLPF